MRFSLVLVAASSSCGVLGRGSPDAGQDQACVTSTACASEADCPSGLRCNGALSPPKCQVLYCGASGSVCSAAHFCEGQGPCQGMCGADAGHVGSLTMAEATWSGGTATVYEFRASDVSADDLCASSSLGQGTRLSVFLFSAPGAAFASGDSFPIPTGGTATAPYATVNVGGAYLKGGAVILDEVPAPPTSIARIRLQGTSMDGALRASKSPCP